MHTPQTRMFARFSEGLQAPKAAVSKPLLFLTISLDIPKELWYVLCCMEVNCYGKKTT